MNTWMKKLHNKLHLLLLGVALIATGALVVACGSSGGGGGDGGATPAAAQSFGEITAKGSVMVNGVKFETTGAQVVMDGGTPLTGDDSKLRVGMVVAVEGEINGDGMTGKATKVTFDDTLQGPVTTKNADDNTLSIMGKTVVVASDTRIDDSVGGAKTLDDVVAGGVVEISGGVDDQGRIVATHIELKAPGEISEVTGKVDTVSPLVVAGISVTTTGATTFPNFTGGAAPAVGNFVEVKGSFSNGTLTATSIELKTGIKNDDNLHFEGFVISGNSNSFVLSGHHLNQELTVTTTSSTIFMGGVKEDVVVGTKLEVQGVLTGTAITASKVKFKENVRIEITAGAPDPGREGIELRLLSGITVITDASTRIVPSNGIVEVDDDLKIRGRLHRDGDKVIATRLEIGSVSSNPDRVILRGPVTAIGVNNSSLTILGVTIPTVGVIFRPNDDNGTDSFTIPAPEFFAKVKIGTVVKAKGSVNANNIFVTSEVELED